MQGDWVFFRALDEACQESEALDEALIMLIKDHGSAPCDGQGMKPCSLCGHLYADDWAGANLYLALTKVSVG